MGLAKELWEKLKNPRKPGVKPNLPGARYSKHQASKSGYRHQGHKNGKVKGDGLTNHERVIAGRAKRQGLTPEQYRALCI